MFEVDLERLMELTGKGERSFEAEETTWGHDTKGKVMIYEKLSLVGRVCEAYRG